MLAQGLYGTGTVAYPVLDIHTQFGKSLSGFNRCKHGIVAKTVKTTFFRRYFAFNDAVEEILRSALNKSYDGAETCLAVGLSL